MSHGEVIEQGTHDDLYARDGMYRGLVDAQRISAEGTGDGYITPEEVTEVEENIRRVASSPGQEISSPLRKTTTRQSTESSARSFWKAASTMVVLPAPGTEKFAACDTANRWFTGSH